MSHVQSHFDLEAERYDMWKKRNWFYYDSQKAIYRERIGTDESVLEVGCGTGDLLADLKPKRGVGIDISSEMIEIAKRKYPSFEWHPVTIENLSTVLQETFDVIFLADVIEHLEDTESTFRHMVPFCHSSTRIIITMANPLWEPILLVLEKLGMKMPEGPHYRISRSGLNRILKENGIVEVSHTRSLLFPTYIPFISAFFNAIGKLPILNFFCLIEILEYQVQRSA